MAAKLISRISLACVSGLYFIGLQWPNDPYFLLVSSNTIVAIGRVALAALLLHTAYQKHFVYIYSRGLSALLAVVLASFGFVGLLDQPIYFALSSIFMPIDYLFAILLGCGFGVVAADHQPGTYRLPKPIRMVDARWSFSAAHHA